MAAQPGHPFVAVERRLVLALDRHQGALLGAALLAQPEAREARDALFARRGHVLTAHTLGADAARAATRASVASIALATSAMLRGVPTLADLVARGRMRVIAADARDDGRSGLVWKRGTGEAR